MHPSFQAIQDNWPSGTLAMLARLELARATRSRVQMHRADLGHAALPKLEQPPPARRSSARERQLRQALDRGLNEREETLDTVNGIVSNDAVQRVVQVATADRSGGKRSDDRDDGTPGPGREPDLGAEH